MKILTILFSVSMFAGAAAAQEQKKTDEAWKARTFTAEELKKYNGRDGMPVYVAVDGIVYDLSRSRYWKTGTHMKMHDAGGDLSKDIHERAPKGIHKDGKILQRMPKVGVVAGYAKPAVADDAGGKPLAAPHKVTKEEVGKTASCPVTGKKLLVAEGTPALELKGKVYYFSDELSLSRFKENPGKYLGGLKDQAKGMLKKV